MRYSSHIFLSLLVTGGLLAQGKIQLKRPTAPAEGSGGGDTPALASAPAPAEKIRLTRDGSAASSTQNAQEGEYTTSRGPESRPRTLYLGPYLGFNVGGAASGMQSSANANGWDVYPILGLRSELYFKRVYGIITDLGYEQNKTYLKETPTGGYAGDGLLRSDYLTLRSMFSYRYSLYKVFSKVKFLRPVADALKPFAGNLQAGFFAKTPLSAQLELLNPGVGDPNDPFYDVKQFARPISGGVMAGLGFELRLGSYIFFFEGQYFRGLLNSYDGIQSRFFNTDKFSDQGLYFSSGIKTGIYGF
jgi:hypothetical protein